jgi:hypothetical protein
VVLDCWVMERLVYQHFIQHFENRSLSNVNSLRRKLVASCPGDEEDENNDGDAGVSANGTGK